jgi:anti-anti-sigma regulatory factor
VIELTGDLDVYTAPRLRAGHSRLVIDLERCEFIDALREPAGKDGER